MVFSLFGKKPPPAPVRPVAKKPVAPVPPPAKPAAPQPKKELESLDFTSSDSNKARDVAPAPKAPQSAPKAAQPAPMIQQAAPKTQQPLAKGQQPPPKTPQPAARVQQAPPKIQQPAAKSPQPASKAPSQPQPNVRPGSSASSLGALTDGLHEASIELTESGGGSHTSIEEAAILYANGQDQAALATLEAAVAGNLGAATDQAWAMLFDLYQLMDKREAFDHRAVEYSIKFEKSPPTWVEGNKQAPNLALATGGHAYVAFVGAITETSDKQIAHLEKLVVKGSMARIEFTKAQDIDVLGAAKLLKAMKVARKSRCELIMVGVPQFIELLKRKLEVGRPEGEDIWLLLIELYQHVDEQEAFEEWALNYAITFELSPPSWESPLAKKSSKPALAVAAPEEPVDQNTFVLTGEMYSAGSDALQRLQDYATDRKSIVVDCTTLKRMDFVSAGMFLNTLTNLQAAGKSVLIRHPNLLVYGLFCVLGINQVANLERRKF